MLIFSDTDMSFLPPEPVFQSFQDQSNPPPLPLSPHALSSCSNHEFQGISPILMRRSMSFSGVERCEEMRADDDLSDDGSQLGEKKRRLNLEQVKALEKSFELGNKLEPERKTQLARAIGLQPRQVAIWFQNRRARWKTKQLEKDYDVLKRQFDAIKAHNDALKTQNKKLHAELLALKGSDHQTINLNKETDHQGSWSNGSGNSCDIKNIIGTITRTPSEDSSLLYSQISHSRYNFPPLSSIGPISQLLQSSAPTTDLLSQKLNQTVGGNDNFCNMFNGIDDQPPAFWPWPEQHHNYH